MRLYRAPVVLALGVEGEEDAPLCSLSAVERRQCLKPRVVWERGKLGRGSGAAPLLSVNDRTLDLAEGAFREHCGTTEFEGLSWQAVQV